MKFTIQDLKDYLGFNQRDVLRLVGMARVRLKRAPNGVHYESLTERQVEKILTVHARRMKPRGPG